MPRAAACGRSGRRYVVATPCDGSFAARAARSFSSAMSLCAEQLALVRPALRADRGAHPQKLAAALDDLQPLAVLDRRHRRRLQRDVAADLQHRRADVRLRRSTGARFGWFRQPHASSSSAAAQLTFVMNRHDTPQSSVYQRVESRPTLQWKCATSRCASGPVLLPRSSASPPRSRCWRSGSSRMRARPSTTWWSGTLAATRRPRGGFRRRGQAQADVACITRRTARGSGRSS